jgi:hypothetical protein
MAIPFINFTVVLEYIKDDAIISQFRYSISGRADKNAFNPMWRQVRIPLP